jgi:hypothetical protein
MEAQFKTELMKQLFSEIEQAWRDRGDRTVVHRLAKEHPEFSAELQEFFKDLELGDTNEISSEVAEAEDRVAQWVRSSGLDLAIAAAKQERLRRPTTTGSLAADPDARPESVASRQTLARADTWIAFLRSRAQQRLSSLANSLPYVNVEYLVLVSRHPNIVPRNVCRLLATFVEKEWNVPAEESLAYLSTRGLVVRAASRPRPFEAEPANFEDLLNRSALTQEQKAFWMQCAAVE